VIECDLHDCAVSVARSIPALTAALPAGRVVECLRVQTLFTNCSNDNVSPMRRMRSSASDTFQPALRSRVAAPNP